MTITPKKKDWFEGTERCAYCGADVPIDLLDAPDIDDEVAWSGRSVWHYSDCEWIRTKAHKEVNATNRSFTEKDVANICAEYSSEETEKVVSTACALESAAKKMEVAVTFYYAAKADHEKAIEELLETANNEGWEV